MKNPVFLGVFAFCFLYEAAALTAELPRQIVFQYSFMTIHLNRFHVIDTSFDTRHARKMGSRRKRLAENTVTSTIDTTRQANPGTTMAKPPLSSRRIFRMTQ